MEVLIDEVLLIVFNLGGLGGLKMAKVVCVECGEVKGNYEKGMCKKCYMQQYHLGHLDEHRKYARRYDRSERGGEVHRKSRQSVKGKETRQRYFQSVKGKEARRRYDQTAGSKEVHWRQRHTEAGKRVRKVADHKRRARKLNATVEGTSLKEWLETQSPLFVCCICDELIVGEDPILEHNIPLSRGGAHGPSNWGFAHSRCNLRKNSKTLEEYWECLRLKKRK